MSKNTNQPAPSEVCKPGFIRKVEKVTALLVNDRNPGRQHQPFKFFYAFIEITSLRIQLIYALLLVRRLKRKEVHLLLNESNLLRQRVDLSKCLGEPLP